MLGRTGSKITTDDLLGEWKLNELWSKGKNNHKPFTSWLLRRIAACFKIDNCQNDLTFSNSIKLGILNIRFVGPCRLTERKRQILFFNFNTIQIRIAGVTVMDRTIKMIKNEKEPFFVLIGNESKQWLAARGRGGGLALWKFKGNQID